MTGINNRQKFSMSKDPSTVAGTGGFAATLKILEETDKESSPRRCIGAALSPLPDFKYADLKINSTTFSSESSSIGSKKTTWEKSAPQLTNR